MNILNCTFTYGAFSLQSLLISVTKVATAMCVYVGACACVYTHEA